MEASDLARQFFVPVATGGLAGCAPRLVPSRSHAALIPDASGPRACALRLPSRGLASANPRRAGLGAPEVRRTGGACSAGAMPRGALCALFTSSQACLRHAGALAARRLIVAPWSLTWPLAGFRLLSFIADPATVAYGARPSRRAGPCPRCAAGRTHPALVSLTASPRRPGCSRAMNPGKTATNDGQGDRPKSLRRTHRSHPTQHPCNGAPMRGHRCQRGAKPVTLGNA